MTDNNTDAPENDPTNPWVVSQKALAIFGKLDAEQAQKFIEASPWDDMETLEYLAAACILSKEMNEFTAAFGISEGAAMQIFGWAMAQIVVHPMVAPAGGEA